MSAAKHTPGPWKVDGQTIEAGGAAEGVIVAEVLGPDDFPCWDADTDEEQAEFVAEVEANARLIAAAPDLLEALTVCVARLKVIDADRFLERDMGDAALAKVGAK